MQKILALAVIGLVTLTAPRPASAEVSFFFGRPGFGLFGGPSVVVPPPVVYAPPVYYGPPAFYGPPAYYGARPYYGRPYAGAYYARPYRGGYYGPYPGRGRHRGWYKHGRPY